jgi:hypothetical protein
MLFSSASKLILFAVVSLATFPALADVLLYSSIPSLNVPPDGNVWCASAQCIFVLDRFSLDWKSAIAPVAEQEAGKTTINMRFDAALLKRIDQSAKSQGISRTAWLHVAASKVLE